jgi:exopolyphosphatase/guanosine-5'-triphosphate,3'-diphosphate pyrophosphatase
VTAPARLATIDLGTNTVRLLVVEVAGDDRWRVIEQDQRVTRLGEGLARSGRLGDIPAARTAAVVAEYVGRARAHAADRIRIVATSAVREAANGRDFSRMIEAMTGRAVEIVSGEDEARLTVLGILRGLGRTPARLLAVDIGGGSTEFIAADRGRIVAAASLRLGVVDLAERYPFPDRVDRVRYDAMAAEIRGRLRAELPGDIRAAGADLLVGTAGTVTTLAALDLGLTEYDAARVQGHRLSRARIEALRDRLGALSVTERARLPCLEPGRADLIVPGVAIVLAALDVTAAADVLVSDWGLREGIVADAVERR